MFTNRFAGGLAGTWIVCASVLALSSVGCRKKAEGQMPASAEPREQRETRFDNGQIRESYSVKVGKDGSFLKDGLFTLFWLSVNVTVGLFS